MNKYIIKKQWTLLNNLRCYRRSDKTLKNTKKDWKQKALPMTLFRLISIPSWTMKKNIRKCTRDCRNFNKLISVLNSIPHLEPKYHMSAWSGSYAFLKCSFMVPLKASYQYIVLKLRATIQIEVSKFESLQIFINNRLL